MEEKNEKEEPQAIFIHDRTNINYLIRLRGRIIDKEYFRKIKHFIFRLQTDNEFIVDEQKKVVTHQVIFRFAISKKLHRKYRNIISNGNYITASGVLRRYEGMYDNDNVMHEGFLIELFEAEEYKEDLSGKIDVPEMVRPMEIQDNNNKSLHVPQLPAITDKF